jgi:hypothetical protein
MLRESVLAHSLLKFEFSKYQQLKARGNSTTAERRESVFRFRTHGLLSIPRKRSEGGSPARAVDGDSKASGIDGWDNGKKSPSYCQRPQLSGASR